jgi:Asparaginase, N-terminal
MNTTTAFWTWKYGSRIVASQYGRGRTAGQQVCCCCIRPQGLYFSTVDTSIKSPDEAQIRKHQSILEDKGGEGRRRLLVARESWKEIRQLMGEPLQKPAGALVGPDIYHNDEEDENDGGSGKQQFARPSNTYIPEVSLYEGEGRIKKRILVLCTGGTLTMAPDPNQGGALAPVEGAISKYMKNMEELNSPDLPFEYHLHEYSPFRDSSDLGPADWATLAHDIKVRKNNVTN